MVLRSDQEAGQGPLVSGSEAIMQWWKSFVNDFVVILS